MLAVLKIKNLALIEDITWEPGRGLISVTGQTGAGKSIIIGALKLILLGERANRDLIRNGQSTCIVEAVFSVRSNLDAINSLLLEHGLEECDGDTLIIKRGFGKRNHQFVNCSACTLQVLKRLGNLLIDIHGPEQHQSLHSRERQLAMLDAYAATQSEIQKYHKAYQEWKDAIAAVEEFKTYGQADDREIQLLRFQLEEISKAALIEEELAELERRYSQARNAARLIDAASQSRSLLQAAIEDLAVARKHLTDVEQLDPESAHFTANFDSARLEIEELDNCLDQYLGDLELDPSAMATMERRIDEVENLKRKYGRTIREVLAFEKEARNRLDKIDHREEEMERLAEVVSKALTKVQKTGAKLSRKRKLAAPRLQQEIMDHLKGLGFTRADFEVALPPHETPQPSGLEHVDFLFGPNPGEPVKPLRTIASSGEMSRVMLAVKSALASQDDTPLMVFDEIDANVGGEIAVAVGEKMATLGKQHQVIAITHMPQVASLANSHFHVSKKTKGKSTVTGIRKLENQNRIAELARMLGGVGEESFALAEKLLQGNDMSQSAN